MDLVQLKPYLPPLVFRITVTHDLWLIYVSVAHTLAPKVTA